MSFIAEPVECLFGACHLTAKRHVVELFELGDEDLLAYMKEVNLCARALKTVIQAIKINYEIHGNSLPHLHVHLYPRYKGDPFAGKPVDYHQKKRFYTEEEFRDFIRKLQKMIGELSSA